MQPITESRAGQRILVVEDDNTLRISLERALQADGHMVRTAESAEAALRSLIAAPVDVMLVDLKLPRRHGNTFIAMARALGCRARVFLMTAYGAADALASLSRYEVQGVLYKDGGFMTRVRASVLPNGREPRPLHDALQDPYWIRKSNGVIVGPVPLRLICELLASRFYAGQEEVSLDGELWVPISAVMDQVLVEALSETTSGAFERSPAQAQRQAQRVNDLFSDLEEAIEQASSRTRSPELKLTTRVAMRAQQLLAQLRRLGGRKDD